MKGKDRVRRLAIAYLVLQAVAVVYWWVYLALVPSARAMFMLRDAPHGSLLAFAPPDLALLVLTSLAAAYGIWKRRDWAWGAMCMHAGAGIYAALYSLFLPSFGEVSSYYLGGYMMLPYLVVPPYLVLRLKPC